MDLPCDELRHVFQEVVVNERVGRLSWHTCGCTERGNDVDTCTQVKVLHRW